MRSNEPLYSQERHVQGARLLSKRRLAWAAVLVAILAAIATIVGPGLLGGRGSADRAQAGGDARHAFRKQLEASAQPDFGAALEQRAPWVAPLATLARLTANSDPVEEVVASVEEATGAAFVAAAAADESTDDSDGDRDRKDDRSVDGNGAGGNVEPAQDPEPSPSESPSPSPSPSPDDSPSPTPEQSPEPSPSPSP